MCENKVDNMYDDFKGEDDFENWILGNVDEVCAPVVLGDDADERSQSVVEDASDEPETKDEEPAVPDYIHSMEPPVYPPYEDLFWDADNNKPYEFKTYYVDKNGKPETETATASDDLPPEMYDDEPENAETNRFTMEPAPTDDLPQELYDEPEFSESDVTESERTAMETKWAEEDSAEEEAKAKEAEERKKKEAEERYQAQIAAEKANADLHEVMEYFSRKSTYTLYNYAHLNDDELIKNSFLRTDNDSHDDPAMAALVGAGYTGYTTQEAPRMYIRRTNGLTAKEIKDRYILNKDYTPIMGVHGGNFQLDLRSENNADMDCASMKTLTELRRKECVLCMDRLAETQALEEAACKAKGRRSSHDSGSVFDIYVPETDKRWVGAGFGGKWHPKTYDDLRQIALQFLPAYTQVSLDDPSLGSYTVMALYHEEKHSRKITLIIIPRAYYPNGNRKTVVVEARKNAYRNADTKVPCHEGDENAELFRRKGDAMVTVDGSYFGKTHRNLNYTGKKFIFRQHYVKGILAKVFFAMGGCRFVTGFKIGRLELFKARKADKKNGTLMYRAGMAINRAIIKAEKLYNEWAAEQIQKYGDVVRPLIESMFAKINSWMDQWKNRNTAMVYYDLEGFKEEIKNGEVDYNSYDAFCFDAKSQDDIDFIIEHCANPMIARFDKIVADTGAQIQAQFAC